MKTQIENRLKTLIPQESNSLYKGACHALLAPAKRVRPLLTLFTAQMFNEDALTAALDPACALEMVHTYSLIHDDLPCMDNDDFRRGLPTVHKVYSEGHAVLVGDYLLTQAFEVLTKAPFLTDLQKIELIQTLTRTSGGEGMIGGQILDIEDSNQIEKMHSMKTAALFSCAVQFGAIVAKASESEKERLKTFGLQFGQLFQLVDDLLDNDHPLGQQAAQEKASTTFIQAQESLNSFTFNTTPLLNLTSQVFHQLSTVST